MTFNQTFRATSNRIQVADRETLDKAEPVKLKL